MLIVERPQTDPYFNIAAEEYLLKNLPGDCFMLWQNEPSVIVGKHQNTLAEIDFNVARHKNIPVIRRITGGGTVYHDEGNLNFTFIKQGQEGKLVDYSRFLRPIIAALNQMGVPARHEGKSDIRVNALKISGNSEHVYRNRVLHHGTLLFNSNLEALNEVLRDKSQSFKDKSVQSVRSAVANITDFLASPLSVKEFQKCITDHIKSEEKNIGTYTLTAADIAGINDLVNNKYASWEWNYGYSPDYVFTNRIIHKETEYMVVMEVKSGAIKHLEITSDGKISDFNQAIRSLLIGTRHHYQKVEELVFVSHRNGESINFDPNILLKMLF
jgi:lipoate-protein ligase A